MHLEYKRAIETAHAQPWAHLTMEVLPRVVSQRDRRYLTQFDQRIRQALLTLFPRLSGKDIPDISWEEAKVLKLVIGESFIVPTVKLPADELASVYQRMGYLDSIPAGFAAAVPTAHISDETNLQTRPTTVVFIPLSGSKTDARITRHEQIHAADPHLYDASSPIAPAERDIIRELKPWVGESGEEHGTIVVEPTRIARYLRGRNYPYDMLRILGVTEKQLRNGDPADVVAGAISELVKNLTRHYKHSDVVRKLMSCKSFYDLLKIFPEISTNL